MFEVSWCVGLYVTILLLEFLPVPLERFGLQRAMDLWKRWSGAYVAFAATLFVYLLSRNLIYAAAAAVLFSFLAWAFKAKGKKAEPIMLAIAAVTLSTMHQSSLGSLFLLMPDKLGPQWWSPVMPVSFFLSSIAAGTGLVVVVEMWIATAWNRPLRIAQLAAMGKIVLWSLGIYLAFRLGDMILRGQLVSAFSGTHSGLFEAELLLGGLLPLLLLGSARLRTNPLTLFLGSLLATIGVVFNRINVVLLAMNLRGAMPQVAPESYVPTIFEWGISIGLIAATIFLFGLGARLLPLLPVAHATQGD
jgi:formate dehydrogenase iron-sulfur subunit